MGRVKREGVSRLKTRRNDLALILALLLLGGALALYLRLTRQSGGTVSVRADGETVMELPLDADTRVELGSGVHTNVLVIENGAARVIAASCPDQICVRRGAIRYEGESIVCLPHRLIVTVQGGQSGGVDGSTG